MAGAIVSEVIPVWRGDPVVALGVPTDAYDTHLATWMGVRRVRIAYLIRYLG